MNNKYKLGVWDKSRPHVHVGAFKDNEPLAVEVDRDLLINLQSKMGEVYWMFGITDDEYMKYKMQQ